jgi:hypothetical protein
MLYVAGQITQAAWGPYAERYQHGKRLRKKVPRERHGDLRGPRLATPSPSWPPAIAPACRN